MDTNLFRRPIKVILTDDDIDDRDMFEQALKETAFGCDFQSFGNGLALLTYLEDESIEMPDIIFLDLNMPVLDGVSALLKIRSNKKFAKVPTIVIYSTSDNITDIRETFNSGANLYITKPYDYGSLTNILNKVIPNHNILSEMPATIESFCFQG